MADYQLFIGGELRDAASGETFTTTNPGTGQAIAEVAKAGFAPLHRVVHSIAFAISGGMRGAGPADCITAS